MNILRIFLGIFFTLAILFSTNLVLAKEATSSPKTTFEAFWPLTAGRTIDDKLYFLKTWKENLRGMLIFGNPQKAEYAVYLGTKRVLEADKLLKENKKDFADQTLRKAMEQFDLARNYINGAKVNKLPLGPNVLTIKPRLENLSNLIPTMPTDMSAEILQKIKNLLVNL